MHEPCLGPRGVDVNDNPDDTLVVHRLRKQRELYMDNWVDEVADRRLIQHLLRCLVPTMLLD